jgi:hypothetical protein
LSRTKLMKLNSSINSQTFRFSTFATKEKSVKHWFSQYILDKLLHIYYKKSQQTITSL